MATQAKQQKIVLDSLGLAKYSKLHTKDLGSQPIVDGQAIQITLPQNGLAHTIYCSIQLSVTIAGTITGGVWANRPPAPVAAIKNISITNNANLYIRNLSGWGHYMYERHVGVMGGMDWFTGSTAPLFSANNATYLGTASASRPVGGALITAGTYSFNMSFPITLPFNHAGDAGLIVLQQSQSYWYLTVQIGNLLSSLSATGGSTDIIQGLVGTGLTYSYTGSIAFGLKYWDIVNPALFDYSQLLSHYVQVNEQFGSSPTLGINTIQPARNDIYTLFINECCNSSTLNSVANVSQAVPVASLSQLVLSYAGAIVGQSDQYGPLLCRNYWENELPNVDGTWVYDMRLTRGIPGKPDSLAGINNQQITDLIMTFNLASLTLNSPTIRTVMQSLRPLSQVVQFQG